MARLTRALLIAAALGAALPIAHASIALATRPVPPRVELPPPSASRSWTGTRGGVRVVLLQGSPEQIGADHSRLLRSSMIAEEDVLWGQLKRHVPWWIARVAIEDLSRLRYRHVDRGIPEPRRRELAAEALAFQPDPFASRIPTYQRMTLLHALYDVSLSFEHSPLIGCTSFALGPASTADGHVLVARAFDFEAGDFFDREKVVFLVREDGAIPFASVAWPGFVGVVTGMNARGLVAVVHGGRAREPSAEGIPVAFSLREVLSRAGDTDEAIAILRAQRVMVSHIVFLADARGHFAAVERAPGAAAYVRETRRGALAVTNHFEGPLASDPKNLRVRETSTTLARRARVDELLARVAPRSATPATVLGVLRDHGCAGGAPCPLGDRRAIDALIAAHGIVADATDRVLWVSAGPELSGAFVRFDLRALLAPGHDPAADGEPDTLPPDPILSDGRWAAARAAASTLGRRAGE